VQVAYPAGGGGEAIYDVHTDHLDTPRMLTDADGTPVWWAGYEAFGRAHLDTAGNTLVQEFNVRFPGQYYDAETERWDPALNGGAGGTVAGTGLHYNRFRYYDPGVGRYVSADPIGQWDHTNLYQYGFNDPTNSIDPYGEFAIAVPAIVVGTGLALGTAAAAWWAYNNQPTASPDWPWSRGNSLPAKNNEANPDTCDPKTGVPAPVVPPYNSDPTVPPGPGFEWTPEGNPKGSWFNPETEVSVRPDPNHPGPIGPHNDIQVKGNKGKGWRQYPDGSVRPK